MPKPFKLHDDRMLLFCIVRENYFIIRGLGFLLLEKAAVEVALIYSGLIIIREQNYFKTYSWFNRNRSIDSFF